MNKYTQLSDFEINKKIAVTFHGNSDFIEQYDNKTIYVDGNVFDPCNNPTDAMPIVIENKIDLTHLVGDMVCAKHKEYWCIRKNPYRAGCEVYLLMKDAENEKV